MKAQELVHKVEKSTVFTTFRKDHPDYYLATVFFLENTGWTTGYYSKKEDRMITFTVDPVKQNPQDEVFKKDEFVTPLEIDDVKISIDKADEIIEKLHQEKYKVHDIVRKIILIQNHGGLHFNVTLITKTFHVINVILDAISGKVLKETIQNAMSFQEK